MYDTLQFSLYCLGLTSLLICSILAIFGRRNLLEYFSHIAGGLFYRDGTVLGFIRLILRVLISLYSIICLLIFTTAFIAVWSGQILELGFVKGFFLGWLPALWSGGIMMILWPFMIAALI